MGKIEFLENLFKQTRGVSIPLLCVEYLRFQANGLDASWAIAKVVISGLGASGRVIFENQDSVDPRSSRNVLASLAKFASEEYWFEFAALAEKRTRDQLESVIIRHIRTAREPITEPNEEGLIEMDRSDSNIL